MLQVTIPVHPLTRRILLSEYGAEPLRIDASDMVFTIMSALRGERCRDSTARAMLSTTITLQLSARLARQVETHKWSAGLALLKYHKDIMNRYAHAHMMCGRPAWGALQAFLATYGVTEDEYGLDTAYKNWQRFGWFFDGKNGDFRIQRRRKAGVNVATLPTARKNNRITMDAAALDALAASCLTELQTVLKDLPPRLGEWLRYYIYVEVGGHSKRTAARALRLQVHTVYRGVCHIRRRRQESATFERVLAPMLALTA